MTTGRAGSRPVLGALAPSTPCRGAAQRERSGVGSAGVLGASSAFVGRQCAVRLDLAGKAVVGSFAGRRGPCRSVDRARPRDVRGEPHTQAPLCGVRSSPIPTMTPHTVSPTHRYRSNRQRASSQQGRRWSCHAEIGRQRTRPTTQWFRRGCRGRGCGATPRRAPLRRFRRRRGASRGTPSP